MWDILGIQTLILAFLVFAPLEHFFAMHEGKKIFRPAWKIDLFYAVCSALITKLGLALVIIGTIYLAALLVPSSLSATVAGLPLWLQVVVAVILSDLGFYAVHRLFHKIPWLWKFHAVHHRYRNPGLAGGASRSSGRSDFDQRCLFGAGLCARLLRYGGCDL